MATKFIMWAPQERERRAAASMTGRYLITVSPGAHQEVSARLNERGFKSAIPLPPGALAARALPSGYHLMIDALDILVVDPAPNQQDSLRELVTSDDSVVAVEPERIVRAVGISTTADYIRGWRDGVDGLATKLLSESAVDTALTAAVPELVTWGLITTKVVGSHFSGLNIKIAVLDTGFDLTHPDFSGRLIVTKNFVGDGTLFHDGVGHGTHCIGTAAGPRQPTKGPRYGIAYDAQIFAGRVLDDTGRGGDTNILQGIAWAISQRCDVISLSLGAPWIPGDPPFSQVYEAAAQRALAAGCLLIVAAGNEASSPEYVGAVGTPGNSPSVLTVAAVDDKRSTAPFSDRVEAAAPGVKGPDLAGPGVDVYSAWPVADGQYNIISGTSMATPHVSGIAALYAEANPVIRGQALKDLILRTCASLPNGALRQGEIGKGLVQAP